MWSRTWFVQRWKIVAAYLLVQFLVLLLSVALHPHLVPVCSVLWHGLLHLEHLPEVLGPLFPHSENVHENLELVKLPPQVFPVPVGMERDGLLAVVRAELLVAHLFVSLDLGTQAPLEVARDDEGLLVQGAGAETLHG